MSDDLLERAARAMREESTPSVDDLAETRARLLASTSNKKTRRTNALRWVLPMAAAFAAGTALAATNGGLERAVHAVQSWLVEAPQQETPRAQKKRVATRSAQQTRSPIPAVAREPAVPVLPMAPAPPVVPASPIPSRPAVAEHAASDRMVVGAGERSAANHGQEEAGEEGRSGSKEPVSGAGDASRAEGTPAVSAPSPDLALYREAHRAHFVAHDYADSLSLWNAYLARFPSGIFTLEARYNRAICLVRLGRKQEAELALRPFAEGQVKGAYRQNEARSLLDALTKNP
jgi:TolA-binding protein